MPECVCALLWQHEETNARRAVSQLLYTGRPGRVLAVDRRFRQARLWEVRNPGRRHRPRSPSRVGASERADRRCNNLRLPRVRRAQVREPGAPFSWDANRQRSRQARQGPHGGGEATARMQTHAGPSSGPSVRSCRRTGLRCSARQVRRFARCGPPNRSQGSVETRGLAERRKAEPVAQVFFGAPEQVAIAIDRNAGDAKSVVS